MDDRKKRLIALSVLIYAAIGGVLYGYDLGVFTGAILFVRNDIPMTTQQVSFLIAAVLGGGAVATLITGPLADWLGRRFMIMVSAIVFLLGVFMVVYASTYSMLLSGRIVQGIGVGIITIVVPLYLTESMPASLRGRGVSIFQLLLTAGILLSGVVDDLFVSSGSWRGMFLMSAIPAVIMLVGSFYLDRSPRWLVMRGRDEEALKVLEKTRSSDEARAELKEIQVVRDLGKSGNRAKGESVFQRRFVVPFLIVLSVAMLNQLIGINSILQYSSAILKDAGLSSNIIAMLGTTAIFAMNFIVTLIIISFIDRIERRTLYSIGAGGLALGLLYCGVIFQFAPDGIEKGYMLFAGLIAFIIFYAMGPGLLVWVVISELLPLKIRSSGMAIALCANSAVSSIWASVFLLLQEKLGFGGVFFIFGCFGILYFLVTFFAIPRVKGRSLEQIEEEFVEKFS